MLRNIFVRVWVSLFARISLDADVYTQKKLYIYILKENKKIELRRWASTKKKPGENEWKKKSSSAAKRSRDAWRCSSAITPDIMKILSSRGVTQTRHIQIDTHTEMWSYGVYIYIYCTNIVDRSFDLFFAWSLSLAFIYIYMYISNKGDQSSPTSCWKCSRNKPGPGHTALPASQAAVIVSLASSPSEILLLRTPSESLLYRLELPLLHLALYIYIYLSSSPIRLALLWYQCRRNTRQHQYYPYHARDVMWDTSSEKNLFVYNWFKIFFGGWKSVGLDDAAGVWATVLHSGSSSLFHCSCCWRSNSCENRAATAVVSVLFLYITMIFNIIVDLFGRTVFCHRTLQ